MNEAQELACRCLCEVHKGTHFRFDTPVEVRDILARNVGSGARLRLFYGDIKTGENWFDEYGIIGSIGRSMGPCKIPLLIHNRRSLGGAGILANCVIAIESRTKVFLYRHPLFKVPEIELQRSAMEGYPYAAFINGENHANFKTHSQAVRWAAFMRGERMAK